MEKNNNKPYSIVRLYDKCTSRKIEMDIFNKYSDIKKGIAKKIVLYNREERMETMAQFIDESFLDLNKEIGAPTKHGLTAIQFNEIMNMLIGYKYEDYKLVLLNINHSDDLLKAMAKLLIDKQIDEVKFI